MKSKCAGIWVCLLLWGGIFHQASAESRSKERAKSGLVAHDVSGWKAFGAHLGIGLGGLVVGGTGIAIFDVPAPTTPGLHEAPAGLLIVGVLGGSLVGSLAGVGVVRLAKAYRWPNRWGWLLTGGLVGGFHGLYVTQALTWVVAGTSPPGVGLQAGMLLTGLVVGGGLGMAANALFLETKAHPASYTVGGWVGFVLGLVSGLVLVEGIDQPRGKLTVPQRFLVGASSAAGGAFLGAMGSFLMGLALVPAKASKRVQRVRHQAQAGDLPMGRILLEIIE